MAGVAIPPEVVTTGTGAESKLALVEYLLSSVDLQASARRGLEWLGRHAGVPQACCAIADDRERRLIVVAEHGIAPARAGEFALELDDAAHPLVKVLASTQPVYFNRHAIPYPAPFHNTGFHAIPLRPPDQTTTIADGLLMVAIGTPGLTADVRWFVEVFGQQLWRLQSRQLLAETRFGRERLLLFSTINAVTDPILLTDPEGKLILGNSRAEKLFSAPEEASEGWRQAVSLNNMLFSAALSTSAVEGREPRRRELLLVDPIDGSDLLFEVLSTTIRDPREGTYVVSVLRNVTDLRRASAELEESYRRLRAAEAEMRAERHRLELIIDSVADPIIVTDPAGDITLMNDRAENLFTMDAAGADDLAQRRVRSNGAHFTSFVSNVLFMGSDERYIGGIHLVDPVTGEHMPVEAIAGQIVSDQGELTAVVTILHDQRQAIERERLYEQLKGLTEDLERRVQRATAELAQQNELLRRQALELEQASALKTQFLANMSHEFRTPLNAILGYTQMLHQRVSGPLTSGQNRHVARIDSNSQHLLALVNDILDITRIEAGRMPLRIERVRLSEVINEVRSELEPIIARSKLAFSTDMAANIPEISTDRQKVKQIVLNFLSNALKFTPKGSVRITVRYRKPERMVAITVTDTGIGIRADDQERVFEDFRQLDTSPTRSHFGTGLGLSICRRLASMLEGKILLQSRVGQGSAFTLLLPRKPKRR
jgi:PAS domain S-box-containing protein